MKVAVPCVLCSNSIHKDQESSILCSKCDKWVHTKCTNYTENDDVEHLDFVCANCEVTLDQSELIRNDAEQIINISNVSGSGKKERPKINSRKRTKIDEDEHEDKERERMKLAERKEQAQKVFEKYIETTTDCNDVKIYTCQSEDCEFSAISLLAAQKHALGHLKTKPTKKKRMRKINCSKCNEIFSKQKDLKAHWASEHAQNECSLCTVCGKEFSDRVNLVKHLQKVHVKENIVSCTQCSKQFQDKFNLRRHISSTHPEEIFQCDQCSNIFANKRYLNQHIKRVHEMGTLKCDQCDKQFTFEYDLKRHLKTKRCTIQRDGNHEDSYQCLECNKTMSNKSNLTRHMKLRHQQGEKFICKHCNKLFPNRYNLNRHKKTCFMNINANANENNEFDQEMNSVNNDGLELVNIDDYVKLDDSDNDEMDDLNDVDYNGAKIWEPVTRNMVTFDYDNNQNSQVYVNNNQDELNNMNGDSSQNGLVIQTVASKSFLSLDDMDSLDDINALVALISDASSDEGEDDNEINNLEVSNIKSKSCEEIKCESYEEIKSESCEKIKSESCEDIKSGRDIKSENCEDIKSESCEDIQTFTSSWNLNLDDMDTLQDINALLAPVFEASSDTGIDDSGIHSFKDSATNAQSLVSQLLESVIGKVVKIKEVNGQEMSNNKAVIIVDENQYDKSSKLGLFMCKMCDCVFRSESFLLNHELERHLEYQSSINQNKYFKHPCGICGKSFRTNNVLKNHVKDLHEANDEFEQCTKCNSVFMNRYLLLQHYPCIKCQDCNQLFKSKKSLSKHVNAIHGI